MIKELYRSFKCSQYCIEIRGFILFNKIAFIYGENNPILRLKDHFWFVIELKKK